MNPSLRQTSNITAPENVRNASAVETRMMRAMRPLSALNFSARSATLLALGNAATSTMTVSANLDRGTPSLIAPTPTPTPTPTPFPHLPPVPTVDGDADTTFVSRLIGGVSGSTEVSDVFATAVNRTAK